MTRAAIGAIVVAVAAAACSVDRRSDGLACDDDGDCDDGRECSDEGFCIYPPDARVPDARIGPDADPNCPSQCSSCSAGYTVCTIDCPTPGSCFGTVSCPPDMDCVVNCAGSNSCANGVDCQDATACAVNCIGNGSCDDPVDCGAGRCVVACTGNGACDRGADCNTSCACDVTCAPSACGISPSCTAAVCDLGTDCSSTADPTCNTCP